MTSKSRMVGAIALAVAVVAVAAGILARSTAAADPGATATLTVAPTIVNAEAATLAIAKVTAAGPSALTHAVATFTLPEGASFVEPGAAPPASSAGCAATGRMVSCALASPIGAGERRTAFVVFKAPPGLGAHAVGLSATFKEQSASGSSQRPSTTVTAAPQSLEVAAEPASKSVSARCTTAQEVSTDPATGEVSTLLALLEPVAGLPCNPLVIRERPRNEVAACAKALIACTGEVSFFIPPSASRVTIRRFVPPGNPLPQPTALPVWELNDERDESATLVPRCPLADGEPQLLPLGAPTASCTTGITRAGRTYTIGLLVNGTGVDPGIAG